MTITRKQRLAAAALFLLFSLEALSQLKQNSREEKHYYAVVFLNRGHVTGGTQSNVGLFRRSLDDTIWTNIYRRNLLSFGMGLWEGASGRRYYIAAGSGLHRSVDRGKTWRVLTDWRTEEVLTVAPDPVDSSIIYIGTPFGVFKSTDEGRRWEKKMAGMKRWFVKKILIDVNDRKTLYAVAEDDVYKSTNSGEQWVPLHTGLPDIQALAQNSKSPRSLIIGGEDDGIRVTKDGGLTWQEATGIPRESFYGITIAPNGQTVYAGGFKTGLWVSSDAGASWKLLWKDSAVEAIATIYVHQNDQRHLMVGTTGQGIFESFDGGTTWRSAGLQGCQVRQIAIYP